MNEEKRKQFKLPTDTLNKIQQLKFVKEEENPNVKIYEKDVILDAIDFAYSSKFGKEVFDQTISKLENVLANSMTNILNEYSLRFANSLENIYMQNELNKEMLLLILKANEILPETQHEINSLIMMNEKIEDFIKEAVLLKKDLSK